MPEWTLADRLRKIRRDRHLTQEQIADILGIKSVTFASWEAGRTRPHDVVALAGLIETRFGVPAAWTLGIINPTSNTDPGEAPDPGPQQPRRRWTDGLDFAALA